MREVITAVLLSLMTGCGIASSLNAQAFKADPNRHIEILGVIDGSVLPLAQKIIDLSSKSSKPITMLINSPGGYVFVGDLILSAMRQAKARGVKFRCMSGVWAASMAFSIYAECDTRYAYANTRLLFHPMSIRVPTSRVSELRTSLHEAVKREAQLKRHLLSRLQMKKSVFYRNYRAETFWTASSLREATFPNFIKIVKVALVKNVLVPEKQSRSLFGKKRNTQVPDAVRRVLNKAGCFKN